MKKRYLYACLFAVPGFFIALIVAFIAFGSAAGVFWLFVYGDNSWPAPVEHTLPVLFILTFVILWAVSIVTGFIVGRRHERDAVLNRKHMMAAPGMTIAPVLVIVLHQLGVGNTGQLPDGLRCSEYCRERGLCGQRHAAKGFRRQDMPLLRRCRHGNIERAARSYWKIKITGLTADPPVFKCSCRVPRYSSNQERIGNLSSAY